RLSIVDQFVALGAAIGVRARTCLFAAGLGALAQRSRVAQSALALAAHAAQLRQLGIALLAHAKLFHAAGDLIELTGDRLLAGLALALGLLVALPVAGFLPLGFFQRLVEVRHGVCQVFHGLRHFAAVFTGGTAGAGGVLAALARFTLGIGFVL